MKGEVEGSEGGRVSVYQCISVSQCVRGLFKSLMFGVQSHPKTRFYDITLSFGL